MADIWEPDFRPGAEENPFVVDDEDDVIQIHDEEEVEQEVAEVIDITEDDLEPFERGRGPEPRPGEEALLSFLLRDQGFHVRPGATVELKEPVPVGKYAVEFVRITSLARQVYTNNVTIKGHGFTRAKNMSGMLPKQLNECCLVTIIDTHDPRPWKVQAIINIQPENVLALRNLRITNAPYPQHGEQSAGTPSARQQAKDMGILVSRYTYIEYHSIDESKPREWAFVRIGQDEADENFRVTDEVLVNGWRGGKTRGGSHMPAEQGRGHIRGHGPVYTYDLEDGTHSQSQTPKPAPGPVHVSREQKYTAGDTFAGAGGASRGITDAGVQLEFCVDNWEHAVASLNANFEGQGTTIYDIDMHDFIVDKDIRHRVDILHISPPCQVWSPAHTRPGQNDEKNLAILFSCTHLIEKIRPRMFTVEQTFGILHPRFEDFFHSLVHGFTDHGYSVRWKVINFSHYGLPQPRRRLIMIGAGPGEKLPPFPLPTHSPEVRRRTRNGLKPTTTARQALSAIDGRRRHPLHQPYLQPFPVPRAPWDGDKPLPYTVTCGAAENYHWSGQRQFTPQEYALLQGFPMYHKFAGNYIKKQIGNAFPPVFVKLLYRHLVDWLDKQDNVVRVRQAAPPPLGPFRTPTAQRHGNIDRREGDDDDEVTFLSSRKRRQLEAISLLDEDEDDNDNSHQRPKRARPDPSPSQQPKQRAVIDLDEDISALDLVDQQRDREDQDNDEDTKSDGGRSDSATIRESSEDSDSPRGPPSPSIPLSASASVSHTIPNSPSERRRLAGSSQRTPGFHLSPMAHDGPSPLLGSSLQVGPGPNSIGSSSSQSRSMYTPGASNMQGVRRKLFSTTTNPPPQTTATISSRTTSSMSSSSRTTPIKKENQRSPAGTPGTGAGAGTKEEPMDLLSD